MQPYLRIFQGDWSELVGWGLIIIGFALATWALAERHQPKRAGTFRFRRQSHGIAAVSAAPRCIDPAKEWQRLLEIADRGNAAIESVAAWQALAHEEVAALDDAVSQLLSDYASAFVQAGVATGSQGDPAGFEPATSLRPLAA